MPAADDLYLRDIEESDLDLFFAHQIDEVANHMAAFTPKESNSRAAFDARWQRLRNHPGVFVQTAVYRADVIGHVASFKQEDQREITYWLARECWGQGLATKVLQLFLQIEIERPLWGRCAKDNLASVRVMEKNDFVLVGEEKGFANARQHEIKELVLRLD
jgi:RimJ/RimL family protein N-acetyltransferase